MNNVCKVKDIGIVLSDIAKEIYKDDYTFSFGCLVTKFAKFRSYRGVLAVIKKDLAFKSLIVQNKASLEEDLLFKQGFLQIIKNLGNVPPTLDRDIIKDIISVEEERLISLDEINLGSYFSLLEEYLDLIKNYLKTCDKKEISIGELRYLGNAFVEEYKNNKKDEARLVLKKNDLEID